MRAQFRGDERGFTLIELLVVIFISGLVAAAAGGIIFQMLRSRGINAENMALRQVQLAGDRVSTDALQAQEVTVDNSSIASHDVFLTLRWEGLWWNGSAYQDVSENVTYSLEHSGTLHRLVRHEVSVDALSNPIIDSTIVVGEYLVPGEMSCTWDSPDNESFTFTVTATVADRTQSRSYMVKPRPGG